MLASNKVCCVRLVFTNGGSSNSPGLTCGVQRPWCELHCIPQASWGPGWLGEVKPFLLTSSTASWSPMILLTYATYFVGMGLNNHGSRQELQISWMLRLRFTLSCPQSVARLAQSPPQSVPNIALCCGQPIYGLLLAAHSLLGLTAAVELRRTAERLLHKHAGRLYGSPMQPANQIGSLRS